MPDTLQHTNQAPVSLGSHSRSPVVFTRLQIFLDLRLPTGKCRAHLLHRRVTNPLTLEFTVVGAGHKRNGVDTLAARDGICNDVTTFAAVLSDVRYLAVVAKEH